MNATDTPDTKRTERLETLETIGEALGAAATVKSVFGEPIRANGKTVVPVARVAYGFGRGFGSRRERADGRGPSQGGGGGGGVRINPSGVLEVTDDGTRFVPYVDPQRLLVAAAAGAAIGALLVRRRRR